MSTSTKSGDVLRLMEDYDFKSKITATIVFSDSDEDEESQIRSESVENKIKSANNNDENKNFNTTGDEIIKEIGKISQPTKRKDLSHPEDLKEKKRKTTDFVAATSVTGSNNDGNKKLNTIADEIIAEIGKISQPTKKKDLGDLEDLKDKKRKTADCVTSTSVTGSLNSSSDQRTISCNSQMISRTKPNSVNTQTLMYPSQRNKITMQTSLIQNQNDINMKANECMQNLLNVISTHMVLIMKSFVDYNTLVINNLSDKNIIANARKHFLDTKKHFFYLSYSTVVNIMLPKENDEEFVKDFIRNTIKIANYRHLYPKFTEIDSLYREMIGWAKYNLHQLQTVKSRNCIGQNPLLSGILNKGSLFGGQLTSNQTSSSRPQQYHLSSDATCLFKSGASGNEISIGLTPTSLNTQGTGQQAQQSNQNVFVQSRQPLRETRSFENFIRTPESETAFNLNSTELNSSSTKQTPNVNPNPNMQSLQMPNNNMKNYARTKFGQEFEVFSSAYHDEDLIAKKTATNPKIQLKKLNQPKCQPSSKQFLAPPNQIPPTDITREPPPYFSSGSQQDYIVSPQFADNQYTTSAYYNLDFQEDIFNGQADMNRSLSRDSGFMSPSSSLEQTCCSTGQQQTKQSPATLVTPMITHVTSLNPSVAYIKDGQCYVCGTRTKKMCLGCYNTYYCSHQCQSADWSIHIAICKP